MESQAHGHWVCCTVTIVEPPGPDAPSRPVLRDLLEEVDMGVEEEREAWSERVDVQAALQPELHVGEAIRERERELLRGRRPGLSDVVARDREWMPIGHMLRAELHQVTDQPQMRPRWEDPLLLRDVFLQDVGLERAVQARPIDALAFGRREEEGEGHDRRAADRHRRRDVADRYPFEELYEIVQRVGRDTAPSHFALAPRVV